MVPAGSGGEHILGKVLKTFYLYVYLSKVEFFWFCVIYTL